MVDWRRHGAHAWGRRRRPSRRRAPARRCASVPALRDDAPCRLPASCSTSTPCGSSLPGRPAARSRPGGTATARPPAPPRRGAAGRGRRGRRPRGGPDPRRPLRGAGRAARRRRPAVAHLVGSARAVAARFDPTSCGRRSSSPPAPPPGQAPAETPPDVVSTRARDRLLAQMGLLRSLTSRLAYARSEDEIAHAVVAELAARIGSTRAAVLSPLGGGRRAGARRAGRRRRIADADDLARVGDTAAAARAVGRRPGAADPGRIRHGRPRCWAMRTPSAPSSSRGRAATRSTPSTSGCSRWSPRTPPSRAGTCACTRRCARPPRSPRRCSSWGRRCGAR